MGLSLVIGLLFFTTLLLFFYFVFDFGYGDLYSISIICFLLASWLIPMIFFENLTSTGTLKTNTYTYIIIFSVYLIFQFAIRFILVWVVNILGSIKLTLFYMFGVYAILLLIAGIIGGLTSIIFLAIGAGLFTGTYGLEARYLAEQTSERRNYITTVLVVSLPLIGALGGDFISTLIYRNITETSLRAIIFAFLGIVSLIMTLLWIFKEKRPVVGFDPYYRRSNRAGKIDWHKFWIYPCFFGIISFSEILMFNPAVFIAFGSTMDDKSVILYAACLFVSFIVSILLGQRLLRRLSAFALNNFGLGCMFSSLFIGMILLLINYDSWQIWFFGLIIYIIGFSFTRIAILGDVLHIDIKTKTLLMLATLSIQTIFQLFGFLIGILLYINEINVDAIYAIVIPIVAFALIIYLIINIKHKKILNKNRLDFIEYEFRKEKKFIDQEY